MLDHLAEAVEADEDPPPFHWSWTEEEEGVNLILCRPTTAEVRGGASDGEIIFTPFQVDIGLIADSFSPPAAVYARLDAQDPCMLVEGEFLNRAVAMRIYLRPLACEHGVGAAMHVKTGVMEDL